MLAVALALGAALSWGVADYLGGATTRTTPLVAVAVWSQGTGLLIVLGLLAANGLPPVDPEVLAWGLVTGIAYVFGLAAFYKGLATGRMGLVAPIAGLSAALPVAVGVLSGDEITALQAGGVVIAIFGVALTTRERDEDPGRTPTRVAVGLGAVAAVGIGLNLVGLEAATDGREASALLWVLAATRVTALVFWFAIALRPGARGVLRGVPRRTLVVLGVLDVLANVLFGLALRESLLTLAAVLASLHPVITVALSARLLGERLLVVQRVGIGLAVAGAALLST